MQKTLSCGLCFLYFPPVLKCPLCFVTQAQVSLFGKYNVKHNLCPRTISNMFNTNSHKYILLRQRDFYLLRFNTVTHRKHLKTLNLISWLRTMEQSNKQRKIDDKSQAVQVSRTEAQVQSTSQMDVVAAIFVTHNFNFLIRLFCILFFYIQIVLLHSDEKYNTNSRDKHF